ncbi:putative WD repeat-containing protein all2124 [Nostoc sp, PCC 7120] [Rhizoctonia solani]|uniref:Putative WD repeat-containing protein all2124 [Nostoc sp, PCC 7120] n=1 Tax=Rhizoctonia solani TaxID=456999 RepID=A0A0K6GAL7_9AGAM|nr:putative WD repeat-containing protein all2124 [Nostoc sp, PCC 7120] [Rhizoctonia solani]
MFPFIRSLVEGHSQLPSNNLPAPGPAQTRPSLIIHEGHTDRVKSVSFSPDGQSVVSGSHDKTIRVWDVHSLSAIGDPLKGHDDCINSLAYSPLGNMMASGGRDRTIRLWDTNTGRQLGQPLKSDHWLLSIAFSPDAKLIASSGIDTSLYSYTIKLCDVGRKANVGTLKGHTDAVLSVNFSPDGTRLVSGSRDHTIRIWDVERGVTIIGPMKRHTGSVDSSVFSPDGAQLFSCSSDSTLRHWDARDGKMIQACNSYKGHKGAATCVAFSPRGTYVASGGLDATVRLWDIRTGRQVDQPFEEHTDFVYSVAFSPCGQYIASGSGDYKVIIRSILGNDPETSDHLESCPMLDGEDLQNEIIQMSTQQMFDCLTDAGCIDLSSHIDISREVVKIASADGFGDIWMSQLHNGTKVMIKAWRTGSLEHCGYNTLKRAARELFYWSRMEHKNIHRLMGVIVFRHDYLGMVSEWMENGNLHKYLRTHPGADRYNLCIDVASGLEYMHDRNTIHGDLKAANILVSSDGIARLSDFEFTVMSESGLVSTISGSTRSGSIRWAAPEMFVEAPKRTKRSDIYALGMTMLVNFNSKYGSFTR